MVRYCFVKATTAVDAELPLKLLIELSNRCHKGHGIIAVHCSLVLEKVMARRAIRG
jgi:hypothetical protein